MKHLKPFFRLRIVFAILAFFLLASSQPAFILAGLLSLMLVWVISDIREQYWKTIKINADEDRPE